MSGGSPRPRQQLPAFQRNMQLDSRVLEKDEELVKRDPDFKPRRARSASITRLSSLIWHARRRRTLAACILAALLFVFVQVLPLPPIGGHLRRPISPEAAVIDVHTPPRHDDASKLLPPADANLDEHHYDGPIKYPHLASSLENAEEQLAHVGFSRNIVFVASSLQSIAILIPLACEMGRWGRAEPHLAIFGRSTLALEEILDINGVTESCHAQFHDARPDFAQSSSDARAERSVRSALYHITRMAKPRAFISDRGPGEDSYFRRALTAGIDPHKDTLIDIPDGKSDSMLWLARLDAISLSNWFTPTIDIIVQAPRDSAGALIRLLKSLTRADYSGVKFPRLQIDLPPDVDQFTKRWTSTLHWPPLSDDPLSPSAPSALTLRHRISPKRLTPEAAALRFIEAFYPTSSGDHHVLVLSPNAELSPMFYQYMYYTLLEYRYSAAAIAQGDLAGISLDVATSILADLEERVQQPVLADMASPFHTDDPRLDQASPVPFLKQAPSADATLIFGDRWTTLHDFLARRMLISDLKKTAPVNKIVSETVPAWTEYLLELMRARAWTVLYPPMSFVTVHNDLALLPEEFSDPVSSVPDGSLHFLPALKTPQSHARVEMPLFADSTSLLSSLPFEGNLPAQQSLVRLSHTGHQTDLSAEQELREHFVREFRLTRGGCSAETAAQVPSSVTLLMTADLFCIPLEAIASQV